MNLPAVIVLKHGSLLPRRERKKKKTGSAADTDDTSLHGRQLKKKHTSTKSQAGLFADTMESHMTQYSTYD